MKKYKPTLPHLVIFVLLALTLGAVGGYKVGKKLTNLSYRGFAQKVVAENHDKMIRYETQTAVSLLSAVNKKITAGEIGQANGQKLAADLLRELRYGENGENYFFADTKDGVNVVLYGRKDTEGRNRLNDNLNGIFYIKEILAQGQRPNGGYTDYFFPKIEGQTPLEKRAYSLFFAPFNWVVGTGYYLEDIKLK